MIHIIVATIEGREASLTKLLESLELFFLDDFKIYVIRQYRSNKFDCNREGIIIKNITQYGASHARNIGIELASVCASQDDYFFFPDDDCYFLDYVSLKDFFTYQLILLDIRDECSLKRLGMISHTNKSALSEFYKINCPRFLIKWSILEKYKFNNNYGPGSKVPATEETELLGRILFDNQLIRHIQTEFIIFHPLIEPSVDKVKDYAFSQGILLKDFYLTNKTLFFIYLKSIIRPFIGYFICIFSKPKRDFYRIRAHNILKGYFHDYS